MKRYDLIVVGAGPAGQRVCQNSGPFPLRRHPAEGGADLQREVHRKRALRLREARDPGHHCL